MKCFDCSRKLCKQVLYAATDILLLLTMELDGDTGVLKAEDEGKGEQKKSQPEPPNAVFDGNGNRPKL